MHDNEQAGDREAAGAIAGMQELYGAPPAEPVTEPRWVPAVDGSASHVGIDMANGPEPVSVLEVVRHLIARDSRSWSQIARDAGVSQSQVSRLMHGERDVAVFTTERLAHSLGFWLWLKPVTEGIPLDLLVVDPTDIE